MDTRLKSTLISQVKDEVLLASPNIGGSKEMKRLICHTVDRLVSEYPELAASSLDRDDIAQSVINDTLYYGPLTPLLFGPENADITEIVALGTGGDGEGNYLPPVVYVERSGCLEPCPGASFTSAAQLLKVIEKIAEQAGHRCDVSHPMGSVMLPNGMARATYSIPPVEKNGPSLCLRRFKDDMMTIGDLVGAGTMPAHIAEFLRSAVASKCPVVISGGTGSGKTTLLNALSEAIPETEYVITIEDTPELRLHCRVVASMQTIEENSEGAGAITIRDCFRTCLRRRPDRIFIGECRGAEAYDMLQAMQTDHPGSMTTIHANDPENAITRLETLVGYAEGGLSHEVVLRQISESLKGGLIVHMDRLDDGTRRITSLMEIGAQSPGSTITQRSELFRYAIDGVDWYGTVIGSWESCMVQPLLIKQRILAAGYTYDPNWFFPPDQP